MKPLDKGEICENHFNERTNERTIPEWNSFINGDCMEYMKEFPDDYFDLAIVDPPYGAGFTESGGCKGWFSKYHQNPENSGGVLEQVWGQIRPLQDITRSDCGRRTEITRTGGTWARKYAKKSLRGMLPRNRSILKNCFASHGTRLSGGLITSICHLQDALLCGKN